MINQVSDNAPSQQKTETYLSRREEAQPHPFSGPKLHLFRKGQSKSSEMKQRKVKTSEQHQRAVEMNLIHNYRPH